MSKAANLEFGTLARGSEKVFICIDGVENPSSLSWAAQASTESGVEVPALVILEGTPARAVLVLPVLTCRVNAVVEARDAQGNVAARGEHAVGYRDSQIKSKLGTLKKDKVAQEIRNCDWEWHLNQSHITDLSIVQTLKGYDFLRIRISHDASNGARPQFTFRLLSRDGERLDDPEFYLLGDALEELEGYPGCEVHTALYSVKIPSALQLFVIWAHCEENPLLDNFENFWMARTDGARWAWTKKTEIADSDGRYATWFEWNKTLPRELALQRVAQEHFAIRPKFSVIVPLYHTPVDYFWDMANSVLEQTYPNFELVLVNSTPDDVALASAVDQCAQKDERVKVVAIEKNLGITENTNVGIEATSDDVDFLSFFDHDDVIEPDLLYWYVEGINRYPETDLLYCDEDKLLDGNYCGPVFKPDFDMYSMETNNYVCHMLTVRRSAMPPKEFRTADLDGAQDHSLVLAVGEHARNAYHARRVLYHWRIHPQSTAADPNAKPESYDAGKRAIERHFARMGFDATAENIKEMPHCYRTELALKGAAPKVTVVVFGTSSQTELTAAAKAIESQIAWDNLEVITAHMAAEADVAALEDAAAGATGEFILFIEAMANICEPDLVTRLLEYAVRDEVGVVAPKIVYGDETTKCMGLACSKDGVTILNKNLPKGLGGARGLANLPHETTAVLGHCVMMRRELLSELGGIPAGLPLSFWGIGLSLAAREKNKTVVADMRVSVKVPADAAELMEEADYLRLWRAGEHSLAARWPHYFAGGDAFYNPLLRQDGYFGLCTDKFE